MFLGIIQTIHLVLDPIYAANYLKEVEAKVETSESSSSSKLIWTSSKKITEEDIQACHAFLSLRKSLNHKFEDKTTSKNALWQEIATKLNEMGFFVGDGILGREKCRQKFMNLRHVYIKYKDQVRQTGQGFLKKPHFYDELEDILRDKHKSNPTFVLDSSRPSHKQESSKEVNTEHISIPSTSQQSYTPSHKPVSSMVVNTEDNSIPSTSKQSTPKKNKFQLIKKTVRPKKSVLSTVENLIKEERTLRTQQFQEIIETLKKQNEQRHEQTMGIIDILKNQSNSHHQTSQE